MSDSADSCHQTAGITRRMITMANPTQNANLRPPSDARPYAPPAAVTRPRNGRQTHDALRTADLDDPTGGGLCPGAYVPPELKPSEP